MVVAHLVLSAEVNGLNELSLFPKTFLDCAVFVDHLALSFEIVGLKHAVEASASHADLSGISTLLTIDVLALVKALVAISLPMIMIIGDSQ